jgi:hypothetical protein
MPEEKAPNYPGNAHKDRSKLGEVVPEEKKLPEKVVSGAVIQRKKSVGRRIIETFTGDDVQSVGSYVLFEVLIPAAKSTIQDVVTTGIERMLFGDNRPRSSGSRVGYTNYNKVSSSRPSSTRYESDWRREGGRQMSRTARAGHNFDEIVLASRDEAAMVLDQLTELVNKYDVASVSELYALVGISGSFPDDKWGWTNLRDSGIRRVPNGYLLDLPRPEEL